MRFALSECQIHYSVYTVAVLILTSDRFYTNTTSRINKFELRKSYLLTLESVKMKI